MHQEQVNVPTFDFLEDSEFSPQSVVRQDFLPNHACYVLYNIFTAKECQQLIQKGEEYGFLALSNSYSESYRNNQRIINFNPQLRDTLWQRIVPYLEPTIEIHGKHETLHTNFYTSGVWEKKQLNDNFRLCRYQPGNYFKPHNDEGYHPDIKRIRTMKTCMIYLNNDFIGGDTIFYFSDGNQVSLRPQVGMCLIFNQKILHEGATVSSGLKYFIRTDILFEKVQDDSDQVKELNPIQMEALRFYEAGIEEEKNQNINEAIRWYSKATKLYDQIYELYNELYS